MKKAIIICIVLTTAMLTFAVSFGGNRQSGSYVLRQNIVKNGQIIGTITTYFSKNGDWRTSKVYLNGGSQDYGFISGRGAFEYREKEDTVFQLTHISSKAKPAALTAEELSQMPQFVQIERVNGLDAYLIRNLINNDPNQIVVDCYYVPGLLHPIKSVYYEADGKSVHNVEEFVSLEFREPLRVELMQRYDGKAIQLAPDPHQHRRGN